MGNTAPETSEGVGVGSYLFENIFRISLHLSETGNLGDILTNLFKYHGEVALL